MYHKVRLYLGIAMVFVGNSLIAFSFKSINVQHRICHE